MKILVIEDDERDRQLYREGAASESGLVIDIADRRQATVSMRALSEDYDLAIVDRMLPGLDGLSLVESACAAQARPPGFCS